MLCILLACLGLLPLAKCNCANEIARNGLVNISAGDCVSLATGSHCCSKCCCDHAGKSGHHHENSSLPTHECEKYYQISHDFTTDTIDNKLDLPSFVSLISFSVIDIITLESFKTPAFTHDFHAYSNKHTQSLFSQHICIIC